MYALTSQPRVRRVSTSTFACAVTALAIALFTVLWWPVGLVIAIALGIAASAAGVDARSGRIPDRLVVLTAVPVGLVGLVELAAGNGGAALTSVSIGTAVFGGPPLIAHVVSPGAIGFGDVKLAAALGAVLGLVDPLLGVVALCIACGGTALFGIATRRRIVPLGPGLVLGAVAALVVAGQLGEAPLPWR